MSSTAALVGLGTVAVEANHGRWVARCGWPDRCDAAMQLVPFVEGYICAECGMPTTVVWPSADMVAGVERLLLMRRHRKHQNWLPTESLHDLAHENALHGVMTMQPEFLPVAGPVLGITNDRIVADALPTLNPRRELVP